MCLSNMDSGKVKAVTSITLLYTACVYWSLKVQCVRIKEILYYRINGIVYYNSM